MDEWSETDDPNQKQRTSVRTLHFCTVDVDYGYIDAVGGDERNCRRTWRESALESSSPAMTLQDDNLLHEYPPFADISSSSDSTLPSSGAATRTV
jgi:hypothetical protein